MYGNVLCHSGVGGFASSEEKIRVDPWNPSNSEKTLSPWFPSATVRPIQLSCPLEYVHTKLLALCAKLVPVVDGPIGVTFDVAVPAPAIAAPVNNELTQLTTRALLNRRAVLLRAVLIPTLPLLGRLPLTEPSWLPAAAPSDGSPVLPRSIGSNLPPLFGPATWAKLGNS
jgi:hypothetical protein